MSEHTKWVEGGNEYGYGVFDGDGYFVCLLPPFPTKHNFRKSDSETNLKLIIAAPMMREALYRIQDDVLQELGDARDALAAGEDVEIMQERIEKCEFVLAAIV